MLLAININNTETKVGLFRADSLESHWRLTTTPQPTPDVEEPLQVGADRILNTLAASQLFHRDTIVVDFGTATTFDCITADGHFLGGVIMPGIRTASDALIRGTAKLPAT